MINAILPGCAMMEQWEQTEPCHLPVFAWLIRIHQLISFFALNRSHKYWKSRCILLSTYQILSQTELTAALYKTHSACLFYKIKTPLIYLVQKTGTQFLNKSLGHRRPLSLLQGADILTQASEVPEGLPTISKFKSNALYSSKGFYTLKTNIKKLPSM